VTDANGAAAGTGTAGPAGVPPADAAVLDAYSTAVIAVAERVTPSVTSLRVTAYGRGGRRPQMLLTSLPTLLLALLFDAPALWHAFVLQDLDVATALTNYLIAVVVSALMLGAVRRVTASYGPAEPPAAADEEDDVMSVSVDRVHSPGRRATDPTGPPEAAPVPAGELPPAPVAALTAGDGRG